MPSKKERRPDALAAALKFLAARPRSVAEVRNRLAAKGFEAVEADRAVDALLRAGYLDDERFAEVLCGSRVRYRNWGPVKIAQELKGKGVSTEIIRRAVGSIAAGVEAGTAAEALKKWAKKNCVTLPAGKNDKKTAVRAFRFLKGRGFSTTAIFKALDMEDEGLIEDEGEP